MVSHANLATLPLHPMEVPLDRFGPPPAIQGIVGSSKSLRRVIDLALKVAPTDATVLITGETGTGKELIARMIHDRSLRANGPFIAANCGGMPDGLVASELFGHERGSFTGANQRRIGRFELAGRGTILLDEIGEMPLDVQVTLLRVLQERQFERLGSERTIGMNARLLAATNRDLKQDVLAGRFREDLFYRLNVFPIHVPALRDRPDDVLALTHHFCRVYCRQLAKEISSISQTALDRLRNYYWPGNIRELQNVIERAVLLCESDTLHIDPRWLDTKETHSPLAIPITNAFQESERVLIEETLQWSRGVVAGPFGAAAKLGVPRTTLESRIARLGIDKCRFKLAAKADGR